jgi:hypothetical protein
MLTTAARRPIAIALGAAALVVMAGVGAAIARLNPTGAEIFRPTEAISYEIGSKRAVGYFQSTAGKCRLTLMIAEVVDPDQARPTSAARLKLAMTPGESATLDSEEGASMVVSCGADAATVDVIRVAPARS